MTWQMADLEFMTWRIVGISLLSMLPPSSLNGFRLDDTFLGVKQGGISQHIPLNRPKCT